MLMGGHRPTCANGHRGNNRHYCRSDGQVCRECPGCALVMHDVTCMQVCINPTHFVLDPSAAIKLNFSFPRNFNGSDLLCDG